jgi:hypothetical protein
MEAREAPSFDLPQLLYSGLHANAYAKRSARSHARLCKTHQIFSSERWAHRRRVRSRCVLCQRIGKRNLTILRKASAHQDRCLNRHSLHCSFFIFIKNAINLLCYGQIRQQTSKSWVILLVSWGKTLHERVLLEMLLVRLFRGKLIGMTRKILTL